MDKEAGNDGPGADAAGTGERAEDSQDAARRAREMIDALKAALDLVYDPDGEEQLQHMVADYCAFTGLPMCLDLGCCDAGECKRAARRTAQTDGGVPREQLKVHQGSKG